MHTIRLSVFAFLLICSGWLFAKTPGEVAVGGVLGDVDMRGLTGPSQRLSAFRGKPLIINVWASWCGPCRSEMASLDRLSRVHAQGKFAVIGISTDDYAQNAKGFLARAKTSFPHFIDQALVLENMLGADKIPLTIFIDAQGKVITRYYGAVAWDSPEALRFIEKAFQHKL